MKAKALYGPPGTGKTHRLMAEIAALQERGHKASEIGFLSFTRAAANEALHRLGVRRSDRVCTIHSAAYRLLNLSSVQVVNNDRLAEFCSLVNVPFRGGNVEEGTNVERGDEYLALISLARNKLEHVEVTYLDSHRPGNVEEFRAFNRAYTKWKKANGFLDFTDFLEQFITHPVPFGASAVLVDEAQDLSPLQWLVVDELVKGAEEVVIAGDDDQAIYLWGGADPRGMVQFEQKYNAEREVLSQSHRVPRAVHKLASSVISQVNDRVVKQYEPRDFEGCVEFHASINTVKLPEEGDVLVLYRNHAVRRDVEKDLVARRVPYSVTGGAPGYYENKFAHATRTFQKLQRGDSVVEEELNALFRVGSAKTKQAITERNFEALLAQKQRHAIDYPSWLLDFYLDADLFTAPRVRLSSIHSSKGREADTVVLYLGMTSSTFDEYCENPDPEHRVFYVGMTRARKNLFLVDGFNAYKLR